VNQGLEGSNASSSPRKDQGKVQAGWAGVSRREIGEEQGQMPSAFFTPPLHPIYTSFTPDLHLIYT
jgi:hypothetical protein